MFASYTEGSVSNVILYEAYEATEKSKRNNKKTWEDRAGFKRQVLGKDGGWEEHRVAPTTQDHLPFQRLTL